MPAKVAPCDPPKPGEQLDVPVEVMFCFHRVKDSASRVYVVLFWVIWGPIGTVLAVVRLIIAVFFLAIFRVLPKSISGRVHPFLRYVLFPILGWIPWVSGKKHWNTPNPKVVVMNHASNFGA